MSFLTQLSRKGQLLYGFIRKAQQAGSSFNKFYREIRGTGLSYRRQAMLRDWRVIGNYAPQSESMKYVNKDKIISADHYIPANLKHGYRYLTTFRVKFRSNITGEVLEKYASVAHDNLMLRGELEEQVKSIFQQGEEFGSEPGDVLSVTPVKGFKAII